MKSSLRLTKKQKLWISVAVILFAVLVFSIVMFYLWATVEVRAETVTYKQLKSKLGEYVIIPECIGQYATRCKIFYPDAEEGSKHHYGKYTNLTVRNKYFVEYYIDFKKYDVLGYVAAHKGSFEDMRIESGDYYKDYYEKIIFEEVTYFYKKIDNGNEIVFDKGDFHYTILVKSYHLDTDMIKNEIKAIWEEIV